MQLEPEFALAGEATDRVDAVAVVTRVRSGAFVDIYALSSIACNLVSCTAVTLEASLRVHTVARDAQAGIINALIDINTDLAITTKAGFTLARERANGVYAVSIQVALPKSHQAFIDVDAVVTVAIVTLFAPAGEASNIVQASRIRVASSILFAFAFININTNHCILVQLVSLFALAEERSNSIDATPIHASMFILSTLIHINTSLSIERLPESHHARAHVTSDRVRARIACPTGCPLSTFIDIFTS
jgi:hypothetical protein